MDFAYKNTRLLPAIATAKKDRLPTAIYAIRIGMVKMYKDVPAVQ